MRREIVVVQRTGDVNRQVYRVFSIELPFSRDNWPHLLRGHAGTIPICVVLSRVVDLGGFMIFCSESGVICLFLAICLERKSTLRWTAPVCGVFGGTRENILFVQGGSRTLR